MSSRIDFSSATDDDLKQMAKDIKNELNRRIALKKTAEKPMPKKESSRGRETDPKKEWRNAKKEHMQKVLDEKGVTYLKSSNKDTLAELIKSNRCIDKLRKVVDATK